MSRDLPAEWIVPDWPAPARVRALVTTRAGGVSAAPYASMNLGLKTGDDPAAVAENRKRLRQFLPGPPRWLAQVHGSTVVEADTLETIPEADASVACNPGTVCAILIADCLPVLLADHSGRCIAAAHAGWRGLAGGVIGNTIRRMPVPAADLMAWIGPGIGPAGFEVGDDVRNAFCSNAPDRQSAFKPLKPGKWLCDLPALARAALQAAGIRHIHGGNLCAWSDPERFYSYRRDRQTGRMAALIWLEER